MRRILTFTVTVVLLSGLAACGDNKPQPNTTAGTGASSSASARAASGSSKPITAQEAFTGISATVGSAKISGTVTAENDPNKLLGRPHQYTSKITFDDTRIAAVDVSGTDKGDVERGGAIEAFANPADAKARAEYIQTVTKSMPMLAEYDYVHGSVLVRVSRYLTPEQAAEYEAAADALG